MWLLFMVANSSRMKKKHIKDLYLYNTSIKKPVTSFKPSGAAWPTMWTWDSSLYFSAP